MEDAISIIKSLMMILVVALEGRKLFLILVFDHMTSTRVRLKAIRTSIVNDK